MYTSLYLKYRPKEFATVIGQEKIVSVLKGAIDSGRADHAYLFSGSRGTGKTTMARIMAKALGAQKEDVYEIDAASYTGVDNIRELREAAFVLPFVSPKKVYIIDEVHMLSKGAFNALLKILEEPPLHVHFILATTELHKVPDTVLSRCQHFKFKKPSEETLARFAIRVARDEGRMLSSEAALLLAMLGDGSYRDTLTTLQQVLTGIKETEIKREHVENITGAPRSELVYAFVSAAVTHDLDAALSTITAVVKAHLEIKIFTELVIRALRQALLILHSPKIRATLKEELEPERFALLESMGKTAASGILAKALTELLFIYGEMGTTPVPELPLELAIVRLLSAKV